MLHGLGSPVSGYGGVRARAGAVLCSNLAACGCGSCAAMASASPVAVVDLRSPPATAAAEPRDELQTQQLEDASTAGASLLARDQAETTRRRRLSAADLRNVTKLRALDRRVRSHELAHALAAGAYKTGSARYTRVAGPDGHLYAIAGQVSIDTSVETTPEATIRKMRVIRRAALAPADPSAADMAVARIASRKESDARHAMRAEQIASRKTSGGQKTIEADSLQSSERARPQRAAASPGGRPIPWDASSPPTEWIQVRSVGAEGSRTRRIRQSYRSFVTQHWSSGELVHATT